MTDSLSDRFRVLFVCTANRFRSPLAAAAFAALAPPDAVVVSSAGIAARAGAPVLEECARHASETGLDLSEHGARPIAGAGDGYDLVVGFERSHVVASVAAGAAPADAAFTLPDLVAFLRRVSSAEPSSPGALVAAAASARGGGPLLPAMEEVADPVNLRPRRQREIADDVVRLARAAATLLFAGEPVRSEEVRGEHEHRDAEQE